MPFLGGSLADRIENNRKLGEVMNEEDLKTLLLQLAEGLKYIHSLNLVHMDIKPGEFIDQPTEKLSNFTVCFIIALTTRQY